MWNLFIHILYPLPVILLLLLSVPIPARFRSTYRRFTLRITDFVLFHNPIPSFPALTPCALWVMMSVLALAITGLEVARAYLRRDIEKPGVLSQPRCLRWRAERNLWISILAVVLWLCLHRIRVLMIEVEKIKENPKKD